MLNSPGLEAQMELMPVEGVTAKVTGLFKIYDEDADTATHDNGQDLINVWVQYAKGPLTAAAEYNQLLNWKGNAKNDADGMGWMAMANYKFTDKAAATLRYSAFSLDDGDGTTDDLGQEVTFSPSFAVSPNWLVLAEGRYDFGETKFSGEAFSYALESTFSF